MNRRERIRERSGNKIILVGAIDASNVVSFAQDPAEIDVPREANHERCHIFPRRSVLCSGFNHDLLDCPVENVRRSHALMLC